MGFYNPDAPIYLGEQWVPIRNEDIIFNESVNSIERGHSFIVPVSTQLSTARFYVNTPPDGIMNNQAYTVGVYQRGGEARSGPIHSVIIPCSNVGTTGVGVQNAPDNVSAVSNPSSGPSYGLFMQTGGGTQIDVSFWFAISQYAPLLYNKRILGINILTSARFSQPSTPPATEGTMEMTIANDARTIVWRFPMYANNDTQAGNFTRTDRIGDMARFFNNTVGQTDVIPWNFAELSKFEASAGVSRTNVHFRSLGTAGTGVALWLNYMALEIFYCEETRVAFGTRLFNPSYGSDSLERGIPVEVNTVVMRDIAGTANPILPVGEYTVTLSEANLGDEVESISNVGPHAVLNGLREYYAIPGLTGVELDIPTPLGTNVLGESFTALDTHILPQISLHVSGGTPYPQMHVYGRQALGQVWGNNTVTQEVLDSAAGASYSYPWVRYYARRFGNTTVPLRLDSVSPTVSGSGMGVFLSPEEWDDLPEIIDGWKQVTLRFPTAPAMGTGMTPTWRWSATGELAGSRWEVLGCVAPALSGLPGNLLNLATPAVSQLGSATYGQPSAGTTVNMGWLPQYGPYVSGATDDQTSDAVIIFSQDPPAVSGLVVTTLTQAVSGIGQNCGVDPCAIPTAIYYNRLTWTPDTNQVAFDNFNRTSASDWGVMSSGQTWANQGGASTDHIVSNGFGQHVVPSTGNPRRDVVGSFTDTTVQVTSSVPVISTGAAIQTGILLRNQDSSNHYEANLLWNTNGTVSIRLVSRIAGTATTLAETTVGWYVAGDSFTLKASIDGSVLYAKAWKYDGEEPTFWQVTGVSTTITAAGGVGLRSEAPAGNTNTLPFTVSYDNFTNVPVTSFVYEIQRSDTVDTGWQTIMLGSPTVSGFSDFEARVGIVSSYRMREVNSYGFYGSWSSTVSATVTDPGVVVGCLGTGGHVLIFTTNSRQDGGNNLAYFPVWEDRVEEGFAFPEAGWVQLQPMYNKDFYTAFRPLERGGDRFQRNVLVQAAAIAPETLADFTDLRDLAWDTVPYVCVRDEDGNRWFATIVVSAGTVRLNRNIYMAQVDIIEVTDTPTAVSP